MADTLNDLRVGEQRFNGRLAKTLSILNTRVSSNIEKNNSEFGPEHRGFKDWALAFNDVVNDTASDKRAKMVVKDFFSAKYNGQLADDVLEDIARTGYKKPLKELRKKFSEWLVSNEPWSISDMRVIAGGILFNKNNWEEGGTLSKHLNTVMGISSYEQMQEAVESGKYEKDNIIKQYLLALSKDDQYETLKNIYLVARESYQDLSLKNQENKDDEWMKFNLKMNTDTLDRLTDSSGVEGEKIRENVKKFTDNLVSENLASVDFGVYQDKIDAIGLTMSSGEKISLPLTLFVKLFSGVEYLRLNNGDPIGFVLRNGEKTVSIRAETPTDVIKKHLMSVGVSGQPIVNTISVNMVRFTKGEKKI